MGKSLPCRKGYSRMQEESENHKDIKGHGGAGSSRKKGLEEDGMEKKTLEKGNANVARMLPLQCKC